MCRSLLKCDESLYADIHPAPLLSSVHRVPLWGQKYVCFWTLSWEKLPLQQLWSTKCTLRNSRQQKEKQSVAENCRFLISLINRSKPSFILNFQQWMTGPAQLPQSNTQQLSILHDKPYFNMWIQGSGEVIPVCWYLTVRLELLSCLANGAWESEIQRLTPTNFCQRHLLMIFP